MDLNNSIQRNKKIIKSLQLFLNAGWQPFCSNEEGEDPKGNKICLDSYQKYFPEKDLLYSISISKIENPFIPNVPGIGNFETDWNVDTWILKCKEGIPYYEETIIYEEDLPQSYESALIKTMEKMQQIERRHFLLKLESLKKCAQKRL